jgi:hypothetical protein
MSENDWPPRPPPLEAYSRVTNPERFRPLHSLALELVNRLTADYDVAATHTFDVLPGMQSFEQARAPVTLTPVAPDAAPIAIAFTTFPSLIVRYGRWLAEPFPACGCDACGETAAREGERLERLLADVVAGHFREELGIPVLGEATIRWRLGVTPAYVDDSGEAFRTLPRAQARAMQGRGPKRVQWQPWRRRTLH